jgi:hypothetical protein
MVESIAVVMAGVLAGTHSNSIAIGIFAFLALAAYLLPTIVGTGRKVVDLGTVMVVNIFLGWTGIGWIVALALAMRTAVPMVAVAATPATSASSSLPSAAAAQVHLAPPAGWYRQTPDGPVRWWTGTEWGSWYATEESMKGSTPKLR